MTYYDILQVSPQAPHEVIRAAYRALSRTYHPDNKQTGDEKKMRLITEAHATIGNEEKRRAYDRELATSGNGGNGARPQRSSASRTGTHINPTVDPVGNAAQEFQRRAQEILEGGFGYIVAEGLDALLKQNLSPKMREAVKQAMREQDEQRRG